jgi:complement component 1 Q subcomponent-binding protein
MQSTRAFSGTLRVFGSGATDVSLSQKLQSEIQYEKEGSSEVEATPDFLKAFAEQGIWTIEDRPGNDEVTIHRKFGNETIRLMFSIADIQAEEDPDFENPEEEGEGAEDQAVHAYPIRVSLSLTKENSPGALNVDTVCQDGQFMVDNISYYSDARLGTELTAEADWKRRGLYIGPQFDTLDAGVQEEFEKFMQERGINESLALFIPEYSEYKEQQEYVKWLNNVKSFIDL